MIVQNVIKIEPEDTPNIRGIILVCLKSPPEDYLDFFAKAEGAIMAEIQGLVTEAYRLGLEQGAKDD